jgi:hypothetical protein
MHLIVKTYEYDAVPLHLAHGQSQRSLRAHPSTCELLSVQLARHKGLLSDTEDVESRRDLHGAKAISWQC